MQLHRGAGLAPAVTGSESGAQTSGWRWPHGRFDRAPSDRAAAPRPRPAPPSALARARRMSQGAKAVLLWGMLFYVLIQAAVFILMCYWHPMLFDYVWNLKWERFQDWSARTVDGPAVVMLGSSRTDDAFRASLLDGRPGADGRPLRAFNLGMPGTGSMHEWLYFHDMLEAGVRPRLLLIEYLPPLLNAPHTGLISEESWTSGPWIHTKHLVRLWPYLHNPPAKGQEWLESRLVPGYVYRAHLQERLREWCKGEPPIPILLRGHDPWGYHVPEDISAIERYRRWIVTRELYGRSLRHFRPGRGPIAALRQLVEDCRREQIPAMLVVMPESERYRKLYSSQCRATADALLAELRASGTPVIDANKWLDEDDFSDGHHVNGQGAEKFTARLIEEVDRALR